MTEQPQPSTGPAPGGATASTSSGSVPGAPADPAAPPPGAGTGSEPPPLTAFAWRNGLIRPTQGRMLAGVCGAIGRATNTDPVLWRVLLAVLAIFGGVGVVVYLLGWLLLPADGDTGSPVEALLGRGQSATSSARTVVGAIVVLLAFPVLVSEPFRPGPWGVILIGGALLLLLRDRRRNTPPVPAPPPAATPAPYPTMTSGAPMASPTPPTAGATPPFAPHGPYAPSAYGQPPYNRPPGSPPPYAPVPPPPRAPRPRRPRSRLGLLTFSVLLVVVGAMGLFDLAGYSVPGPTYFAAGLTVVGLGLIVGTWVGRARGLIALGIVLMFATAAASVGHMFNHRVQAGDQTWVVTSFSQLQPSYEHQLGNATLDLRDLDFKNAPGPVTVRVSVAAGNLEVDVPPNVDVIVDADVNLGNADVFDQSWGGINPGPHSVTDYGPDGPGGGELHINASVDAGNLEVRR